MVVFAESIFRILGDPKKQYMYCSVGKALKIAVFSKQAGEIFFNSSYFDCKSSELALRNLMKMTILGSEYESCLDSFD